MNYRNFTFSFLFAVCAVAALSISCTAQPYISEEMALRNLREATRSGKLPAESVVADIERRFAGSSTGALAKLLRARIRLETGNPRGALELLASDDIARQTGLADYALWLKAKAFIETGSIGGAEASFRELAQKHPTSLRVRESNLEWAGLLLSNGRGSEVESVLATLNTKNDGDSLLLTASAAEAAGNQENMIKWLRRAYFYAAGSDASRDAETKLTALNQSLEPVNSDEVKARADLLFRKNQYRDAAAAFETYAARAGEIDGDTQLKRIKSFTRSRQMAQAAFIFGKIPTDAKEKPEAFYEMATGYANSSDWTNVQTTVNRMRSAFGKSSWTPKAMAAVGEIAGSQKRSADSDYYMKAVLAGYPEALETAEAQFELAWSQHELKNYRESSQLLTEHLARYVDRDNSYRGQAGYWAARDSERAGKDDEACALYDASAYRYGANWYGAQALERVSALRRRGKCQAPAQFAADSLIPKAVANMKVVTVAAETATARELERAKKSDELSTIGLFDWAIEELKEAKKTAVNSPQINLALAKHFRLKSNNVGALLALKDSYPDYSQMFPEEMGREEWDIFYPLTHWNEIKFWAGRRSLDPYTVAGLIRQETIFNPRARSGANAYGMMQLLIPTARSMARKYGSSASINGSTLFDPQLNIELGTAYMKDQLEKYGRVEYMSVAYNAGPGRVVSWRRTLPLEMDEFVEEIPFSETRGYVKGIVRNTAQYRRLYDESGSFKPNVGSSPIRAQIDSLPSKEFRAANPEIDVDRVRRKAE